MLTIIIIAVSQFLAASSAFPITVPAPSSAAELSTSPSLSDSRATASSSSSSSSSSTIIGSCSSNTISTITAAPDPAVEAELNSIATHFALQGISEICEEDVYQYLIANHQQQQLQQQQQQQQQQLTSGLQRQKRGLNLGQLANLVGQSIADQVYDNFLTGQHFTSGLGRFYLSAAKSDIISRLGNRKSSIFARASSLSVKHNKENRQYVKDLKKAGKMSKKANAKWVAAHPELNDYKDYWLAKPGAETPNYILKVGKDRQYVTNKDGTLAKFGWDGLPIDKSPLYQSSIAKKSSDAAVSAAATSGAVKVAAGSSGNAAKSGIVVVKTSSAQRATNTDGATKDSRSSSSTAKIVNAVKEDSTSSIGSSSSSSTASASQTKSKSKITSAITSSAKKLGSVASKIAGKLKSHFG